MAMHLRGPAYNAYLTDETGDDADRPDGGSHVRPITVDCPKCHRAAGSLIEGRCVACWRELADASVRAITHPDERD